MHDPTRWIPAFAYLVAVAVYGRQILSQPRTGSTGTWRWGMAATGVHLLQVALQAFERGRLPYASMWEALSVAVAVFAVSYLVLERLAASDVLGAPFFLIAAAGTSIAAMHPEPQKLPAHIQSNEFLVHVSLGISGLAILTTASLLAGAWLLQYRQLRRRRFTPLSRRAPDLATLDRISTACLSVGLVMVCCASGLGAFWTLRWEIPIAQVLPKAAMVAFLALWYAVAMLLRRNGRIPARSAAGFALAGIVPVLLVLWVGSHAY